MLIAAAAGLACADQEPRSAGSLSISVGKPVGQEASGSTIPAFGFGYSYLWTSRLAFEAGLTAMKSRDQIALDQLEAGAIVYARSATIVNAWLPYIRAAFGVTSDDFTELPAYPMARVGVGVEYTFRRAASQLIGIGRSPKTWGLRLEASAELFNSAAYDAGRRDGLEAFTRVSATLVRRF
jgi:hypothetical protein